MDIAKLTEEQVRLAKKVITKDDFSQLATIGGADIAYIQDQMVATVVVLDFKTLTLLEKKHIVTKPKIQYIPSFLSYREATPIIEAFTLLQTKPDILVVDSNGILHPRRIGCASHIGLLLDLPTIGVAKNQSCGVLKEDKIYLDDKPVAIRLHTKQHSNPLIISPGHRISLKTSTQIIQQCLIPGKKLPEPLRLAHKFSLQKKTELSPNHFHKV
ncbi:MAG: endonuclease V [Candidatus Woesearchaeota archaeon]